MGRADDADVDGFLGGDADLAHLLLLDRAQQLDLHGERQVGHLVEKQGAAAGCLEKPLAVAVGSGKGTLAMAEEFTLHQVFRDCTAVYRNERRGTARAARMD